MKKTGIDNPQPGGGQACKDKQTLVLFLLGCCLVVTPLLYRPELPVAQGYTWMKRPTSESWQVISTIRTNNSPNTSLDAANKQWRDSHPLEKVPPELALFFNQPLSLRTCNQEDLEMLPGVGSRIASAIIATRQKIGGFTSPEDLLAVPGIGPSALQRIAPLISFE